MRTERDGLISELDKILELAPRNTESREPQGEDTNKSGEGIEMEIDIVSGKRKIHDLSDASIFLEDNDDDSFSVFNKPRPISTPTNSDNEGKEGHKG